MLSGYSVDIQQINACFILSGLNKEEIRSLLGILKPRLNHNTEPSPRCPSIEVFKSSVQKSALVAELASLDSNDVISCFYPEFTRHYYQGGYSQINSGSAPQPAQAHLFKDDQITFPGALGSCIGWALEQNAALLVHGLAFQYQGKGYLCVGETRAGKSTLAAAVITSGGHIVSDDLLLVGRSIDGRLLALPLRPNIVVREGGYQLLKDKLGSALQAVTADTETKWALYRHQSPQYFVDETPIHHILLLERPANRQQHSWSQPASMADATTRLLVNNPGLYQRNAAETLRRFRLAADLLKTTRAHHMGTGKTLLESPAENLSSLIPD